MGQCMGNREMVETEDMERADDLGEEGPAQSSSGAGGKAGDGEDGVKLTGKAGVFAHITSGNHDSHLKKTKGPKKQFKCSTAHAKLLHGITKAHEDHPGEGHGLKKSEGVKKHHDADNHRSLLHELKKGHEEHPSGGHGLKKVEDKHKKKHHDAGNHHMLLHAIRKGHEDHPSDGHALKEVKDEDKNHRHGYIAHDCHKVGDHVILPFKSAKCVYANVVEVDEPYVKLEFDDKTTLWVCDSGLNHEPAPLVDHHPHVKNLFSELKAGGHDERLKKTEGPKKHHDSAAHMNLLHEIAKGHEDHPSDGHGLKKTDGPKKHHDSSAHVNLLHEIKKGHEDHPSDGHDLKKVEEKHQKKHHDAGAHMALLHEIGKGHEDHSSDGHGLKKVEEKHQKKHHDATAHMNLLHEIGKGHEDHASDGHGLKTVEDKHKKKHHDASAHMNLMHEIGKGHEDHPSDGHGLKQVADHEKNHRTGPVAEGTEEPVPEAAQAAQEDTATAAN